MLFVGIQHPPPGGHLLYYTQYAAQSKHPVKLSHALQFEKGTYLLGQLRGRSRAHLAAFTTGASNAIDAVLLHDPGKNIRVERIHAVHVVAARSVGLTDAVTCAILTLAAARQNIPFTRFIFLVVDTSVTQRTLSFV